MWSDFGAHENDENESVFYEYLASLKNPRVTVLGVVVLGLKFGKFGKVRARPTRVYKHFRTYRCQRLKFDIFQK